MKIAFLVNEFPTLSETFFLDQITGLLDRRHEPTIIAAGPGEGPHHPEVEERGLLRLVRYAPPLPTNKLRRALDAVRALAPRLPRHAALLRTLDPRHGRWALSLRLLNAALPFAGAGPFDVVHAHYGPNGRLAVTLRELGLLRGPILTSFHGYDLRQVPLREGPRYYDALFRLGDAFTVGSRSARERLLDLGCPPQAIAIHPVGVPLERYAFAERHDTSGESVTVLSVARLTEVKGLRYAIEAVAQLAPRYPRLRYRIVGDGPLRDALARQIEGLGLGDRVELLGWRSRAELPALYREAQLFLHPCVRSADGAEEGQGLALQEAQALGLPVIATRHGALPEGMLDGQSGYLVPEADASALAERLAALLDAPERWPEMGRAGRRFVTEHFDHQALVDALVQIYEGLAAPGEQKPFAALGSGL